MELEQMTFLDVLQLGEFEEELKKQLAMEYGLYEEVSSKGKLKRMAMDRLRERGLFNANDMTVAYYHIMHKEADGYSASERQYIKDVCAMAYQRTIKRIKAENEWKRKHPNKYWWREIWRSFVEAFKWRKAK